LRLIAVLREARDIRMSPPLSMPPAYSKVAKASALRMCERQRNARSYGNLKLSMNFRLQRSS
jgi:hypothetical protein